MKNIFKILFSGLFLLAASADAVLTHVQANAVVDTRDYVLEIGSPYGSSECNPALGPHTYSWRSSVSCSMIDPLFEQDGTIFRDCTGFSSTGTDPLGGTQNSVTLFLTNVVSSLDWQWNSAYWVTWSISGMGTLQSTYPASGGWYNEGQSYLLRSQPQSGWLFTGWGGGASGGSSATNLDYTATTPTNLVASFSDDPDGDGLINNDEWALGADPWNSDTDSDGFDDKTEADYGLSPTTDSSGLVDYISENDSAFGLYPSNAVLDVAVGQMVIETADGTATLNLQLEESDDLVTWTNAGPPEVWSWPVDGEKKFFRVRSAK